MEDDSRQQGPRCSHAGNLRGSAPAESQLLLRWLGLQVVDLSHKSWTCDMCIKINLITRCSDMFVVNASIFLAGTWSLDQQTIPWNYGTSMATCFVHMQDTAQKFCNLTNLGQLTGWSCIGVFTEATVFQFSLILSALWCGVTLIWSWSFVAITVLVSAYFHLFSMFAHGPMMYSQRLRCQILLGTQRGCSCLYWQCQRQSTFLNSASWANLQCRKLRCVEVDWRSHCMLSGSLGSDLKLWRLDESHAVKTVTGSCALAAKKLICIHLREIV